MRGCMNTIADRIVGLRKEKKLTQQKLADDMSVSTAAVCKWETGVSAPDINTICRLADYFDVSVDYLLGRKERVQRCVAFCMQKECKPIVEEVLEKESFSVQAYIESLFELEAFLEKTLEFTPIVIAFSVGGVSQVMIDRLKLLRNEYGFKLLYISAAKASEFGDLFSLYIKDFKK